MVTATKTGIVAAKTASKRDVEKTAEVTGGLVGNKIADKIKSAGKSKEDDKKIRRNFHSTRKKTTQIDELKLFQHLIQMEFQKLVNLLDTTSDDKNSPRFITKKWTEFNDQSEENYEQRNLN